MGQADVRTLFAGGNRIRVLPDSYCFMLGLKELILCDNEVGGSPKGVGERVAVWCRVGCRVYLLFFFACVFAWGMKACQVPAGRMHLISIFWGCGVCRFSAFFATS